MHTKRALLVAGLLLLPATLSHATDCIQRPVKPVRQISGIVTGQRGQPLANAKVTVLKGDAELAVEQTAADGKFSFAQFGAGDYIVRVLSEGYSGVQAPITIVKPRAKGKPQLRVLLDIGSMGCSVLARAKH
ncbi:MAG: carboxypeptidase-like regulatory domain-containing protein [Candidatus Acidiferrales bacterium]